MKYWLFDGNDVIGPFALRELAARADFSANSLICAEDASEDSAGWQMASFFESFRFNEITGRVEGFFPVDTKTGPIPQVSAAPSSAAPVAPTPAAKPAEQPAKQAAPQPVQSAATPTKTATAPAGGDAPKVAPVQPQPAPKVAKSTQEKPPLKKSTPAAKKPSSDLSFVRLSAAKKVSAPPTPIALAREDVELVLPQQPAPAPQATAPAVEAVSTTTPPAQTNAVAAAATTTPPAKADDSSQKAAAPLPEPEEEIVSTCTLPLVNEILTQSDLPTLPESEFQPVVLPDEPKFDLKEFQTENALKEGPLMREDTFAVADEPASAQTATPVASAFVTQAELPPAAQEESAVQEESAAPASSADMATPAPQPPQTETIDAADDAAEQELVARSGVEDLLPEPHQLAQPTHKKAYAALWILFLAVLACAGWFFGAPYVRALALSRSGAQTTTSPVQQPLPAAEEPAAEPEQQPAPAPAPAPKPVTAADKALAAVQNYQLSGGKGTVASYFDRVYASLLAQGYTANWSVEPLHKNIYIVKYRLTKTRTEPIVYVFQADAARGQLTGALNNVALDLIGRI